MDVSMKVGMVFYNPLDVSATRLNMQRHISMFDCLAGDVNVFYANVANELPDYRNPGEEKEDCPEQFESLWDCDAIVLHYSLLNLRYLGIKFWAVKRRLQWLAKFKNLKIAIPQDEGDSYLILDDWLVELGVKAVFSVHFRPERKLYPRLREIARIENCLPGYIAPEDFHEIPITPLRERSADIFYRGRNLPFCYGRAGRWKGGVSSAVLEHPAFAEFSVDLSTRPSEVITGAQWLVKLSQAKATLGAPGGFSVLDRRGEMKLRAERLEKVSRNYDEFSGMMPPGWDDADYFTITPRHFEAGMTQTAQLLIRSDYSGLLKPDIHYIPIDPDFKNLPEVAARARDVPEMERMANRVYSELSNNPDLLYETFARRIVNLIKEIMATDDVKQSSEPVPTIPEVPDFEAIIVPVAQLERSIERINDELVRQSAALGAVESMVRNLIADLPRLMQIIKHLIKIGLILFLLLAGLLIAAILYNVY